jgi:hypothetical protein
VNLLSLNDVSLKEAALEYAERGWHVLPLEPKMKKPAGEVVRDGLNSATNDPGMVGWYWDYNPNYNIGLVTGIDFDVLDIDGQEAIRAINTLAGGYKHTGPVQDTGRGYHLLFRPSGSTNHTKLADSPLDFRGTRGYIVGSPSIHPDGHRYRWVKDGDLPDVPEFLHSYLFPPTNPVRVERKDKPWLEEALKKEKDIVGIFQEMGLEVKAWGSKAYLHCPFHEGDNQASLVLYLKTNSFTCYGCAATGDPLNVRKFIRDGTPPPKARGW